MHILRTQGKHISDAQACCERDAERKRVVVSHDVEEQFKRFAVDKFTFNFITPFLTLYHIFPRLSLTIAKKSNQAFNFQMRTALYFDFISGGFAIVGIAIAEPRFS